MLVGCMNNNEKFSLEPTNNGNDQLELSKLASNSNIDQQPANDAKQIVSQYDEVSHVRAVNYDNNLLIALDVDHLKRFDLDDIEKKVQNEIKRNFSTMKITLSTDQKILIELRKLEKAIQANDISEEQVKKRLDKLKKLSNEET